MTGLESFLGRDLHFSVEGGVIFQWGRTSFLGDGGHPIGTISFDEGGQKIIKWEDITRAPSTRGNLANIR